MTDIEVPEIKAGKADNSEAQKKLEHTDKLVKEFE